MGLGSGLGMGLGLGLGVGVGVRGSGWGSGSPHQVVHEVRMSEVSGTNSSPCLPPEAVERTKRPSPWRISASTWQWWWSVADGRSLVGGWWVVGGG